MIGDAAITMIRATDPVERVGRMCRIMPTWLEADGPSVPIGTLCRVESILNAEESKTLLAEVVRVDHDRIALAPYGDVTRVKVGARVVAVSGNARLPVGMAFLGRAIDALGVPIDGGEAITPDKYVALNPDPPSALDRETPDDIIETGIRTIDGLLTLGKGQRVGIFSASGVGKTSLLTQLLRQVDADVCVACLVGERGREVEAIWSKELGGSARLRSVLVAATSDKAAALRVRAVQQAVALARHWRDQGLRVFFVLDSVTRFAMALREMGLAAGEPPTVRAYTPSVFATIPRMVEQFGALKQGGSISAIMTVLSETDDVDDPLSELMKSLLDGHLLLSRPLAERGHFPAIDPLKSVSRGGMTLRGNDHRNTARKALQLLARYENARPLIEAGLYSAGSAPDIDAAIAAQPALDAFMQQGHDESVPFDAILSQLSIAVGR
jgi:flagellum-specific ATP synthase